MTLGRYGYQDAVIVSSATIADLAAGDRAPASLVFIRLDEFGHCLGKHAEISYHLLRELIRVGGLVGPEVSHRGYRP